MSDTLNLTPSSLCMRVLARTEDAVYLRLPVELQRTIEGGCSCPHCGGRATWDTLVVPTQLNAHTHTVHMPDGSVEAFVTYARRKAARDVLEGKR